MLTLSLIYAAIYPRARFSYLHGSYQSKSIKVFYRILMPFKLFFNTGSKSSGRFDVDGLSGGFSQTKALDGFIWSESIECNLLVSNTTRGFFCTIDCLFLLCGSIRINIFIFLTEEATMSELWLFLSSDATMHNYLEV